MQQFQQYIGGAFSDGSARFESRDPATGKPWALMPEARAADVNAAVDAAEAAFFAPEWAGMTASGRGKLLYRLADLVAENAQTLAQLETRDTGKIIRETSAQIAYVADYYRYYAGLADKIEGAHLPIDKPDMEVWLRREPVGVVAAVVPWNSQLFLSAVKIGPALAAGCTIALKASEEGPAPMLEFARIFDQAGFPPGVLNIITGFGAECGAVLTRHPKVDHVAFTGGPDTARHIVRNSADNLASTSLELGGKSPFIVFEDADIESAVNAQMSGIFAATGQSCVAGSRLLVEASIHDEFVAAVTKATATMRVGDPLSVETQIGAVNSEVQLKQNLGFVDIAKAEGGEVITGGDRILQETGGYFMAPTIVTGVTRDATLAQQEVFGPVLGVTPFETDEEAIQIANSTVYGLAGAAWTSNLSRAHKMVRGVRTGVMHINTYGGADGTVPLGGVGQSGNGSDKSLHALEKYVNLKTAWIKL